MKKLLTNRNFIIGLTVAEIFCFGIEFYFAINQQYPMNLVSLILVGAFAKFAYDNCEWLKEN